MKTLAERLKFAMETATPKKIRGVDLARAVGVKPPSVSDWLSGKSKKMEGENLLKASKCLGVNPTWLANGQGDMRPTQSQRMGDMTQSQSGQSQSQGNNSNDSPELLKLIELLRDKNPSKDVLKHLEQTLELVTKAQESKDQVANGTAPDTKTA